MTRTQKKTGIIDITLEVSVVFKLDDNVSFFILR